MEAKMISFISCLVFELRFLNWGAWDALHVSVSVIPTDGGAKTSHKETHCCFGSSAAGPPN